MSPHNASSDLKTQKHKRRSTPKQTWWFVGLSWAALTCEGYCFQYSRSLPFCFYRSCRFSPSGAPHTVALHAAPEADQGRGVTNGDCCPKRSAAWHSSLRSGPCTTWHGIPGGERKGIYDILCIQGILRGFKGYIYIYVIDWVHGQRWYALVNSVTLAIQMEVQYSISHGSSKITQKVLGAKATYSSTYGSNPFLNHDTQRHLNLVACDWNESNTLTLL